MSAAEIQKNELLNGQDKLEKKLNQAPEQFQNEIEANTALSGVESQITTSSAKKEASKMAYAMENQKFEQLPLTNYNEIIQNTPLHQKILTVVAMPEFNDHPEFKGKTPEQRAEYLFRKINVWLLHFYTKKLDISAGEPVPEYLHKVILPASEWTLMTMLKYNKHENNVNFLWELTNFSMNSISTMFTGVTSLAKKFTYPYQQAKKLMNVSDFLCLPKNRSALQNLKNPYDFYEKVMQNPIWEKDKLDINKITWSQFNLPDLNGQELSQTELEQKLASQKNKLQKEIWSIQMVESPETVKKLLWVLKKSDTFFEQTNALSNSLLDSLDKYNWVDATLKNTFWFDMFEAVKSSKFLTGILNFVLSLLGFSGGITGLERSWKKRKIDKEMTAPRRKLISESYEEYVNNKKTDENTAKNLVKNYWIEKLPEDQIAKFNLDLSKIQEIMDKRFLSWDGAGQINPYTLLAIKTDHFDGKDFLVETKTATGEINYKIKPELFSDSTNKELFLDAYMTVMLTSFWNNPAFLKQASDADSLAFCLFSGLVIQKDNIIDGMKAEAILPETFYKKLETQQENNWHSEKEENSDTNQWKNTNKISESWESVDKTLVDTLAGLIIEWEARENYWAVNKKDIDGVSIGLMQWHKVRAGNLLKRLKARNPKLFESIMTDPLFDNLAHAWDVAWQDKHVDQFKELMKYLEFQDEMKQQVRDDVLVYVHQIKSRGITAPRAILAMGRIYNAGNWFAERIKNSILKKNWNINDYQTIIAEYNATKHGRSYRIFDKKDKTWESYAQVIGKYTMDRSTAIV